LFLVSGAGLLVITNLLVRHTSGPFYLSESDKKLLLIGGNTSGGSNSVIRAGSTGGSIPSSSRQVQAEIHQLTAQAAQQHAAELHQLFVGSGIALAIMAVVSIGLGWIVAGRALRPLRTIISTTQDISASNLHERLAIAGPNDELSELGTTLNDLLGRLESSFDAQRQFVANASHELRTPLARQRTLMEVALNDPNATVESLRDSYKRVIAAGEQQEELIEALLTLARSERSLDHPSRVDLAAMAEEALIMREADIERQRLRVEAEMHEAPILGDAQLIEHLVRNLVDNAVFYNSEEGEVRIATGVRQGRAFLSIRNTGPVIPSSELERLFQPFERLKETRGHYQRGHGLGLSIVRAIATVHGAIVKTQAHTSGGLDIELRFPPPEAAYKERGPERRMRRSAKVDSAT
jgi:signal transduction histidine kinase